MVKVVKVVMPLVVSERLGSPGERLVDVDDDGKTMQPNERE